MQNLPKILPKSLQNPSKIEVKISHRSKSRPKAAPNRFFQFFDDFWEALGPPKMAPKSKKTKKNRCRQNTCFSTPFFLDFSSFWPPKTTPKSTCFRTFFENVNFVEIVLPSRRRAYFQGSEPPKNHPKSMPKSIRKKHRKKASQKSVLASVLASQNFPKCTQNRKNALQKPSRK